MSRPIRYTYAPTALDADGIALSQSLGGAGALTLNGVLASGGVATLAAPQFVTITSGGSDEAGVTFTITGTGDNGQSLTKTLTGPGAGLTVATTADFKTVTGITGNGATTGNVTAGVNGLGTTPVFPVDFNRDTRPTYTIGVVRTSGTYTVQFTLDDVFAPGYDSSLGTWYSVPAADLVGATATKYGTMTDAVTAFRLNLTVAGSVAITIVPQGI